jgi:hypothetical protein
MIAKFRLSILILIPIILIILPANFFDSGQSVCLSVVLFNQECFACGITRSIMHLIHFDFEEAVYYNMLCLIVFPLLAFLWFTLVFRDIKYLKKNKS